MKAQFEHDRNGIKSATLTFTIETIEDYALAAQRISILCETTRNDRPERELFALRAAVQAWDRDHDCRPRRRDGMH